MTEYCEIAESFAEATSSCPATDVIMIVQSTASGSSSVVGGITQQLLTSTANAVSTAFPSSYTTAVSTGNATSVALPTIEVMWTVEAFAHARSYLIAGYNETAIDTANAVGSVVLIDIPILATSTAAATSEVFHNSESVQVLTSTAHATSSVVVGRLESVVSTALGQSYAFPTRNVNALATSNGAAQSFVYPTNTVQSQLAISVGAGYSQLIAQTVTSSLAVSTAVATSYVWYKDPGKISWVLNTESTAVCVYDNFDFESIAQAGGKTLAVGPDGLYELVGDTDSGELIDSEVVSGFLDFGVEQVKRVDNIYFGYTSNGVISVTVGSLDSGHPMRTYELEPRPATAPRNSRVTPGKGLFGRYWRFETRNVGGSDFEIHDASIDIAISPRRI